MNANCATGVAHLDTTFLQTRTVFPATELTEAFVAPDNGDDKRTYTPEKGIRDLTGHPMVLLRVLRSDKKRRYTSHGGLEGV